MPGSQQIRRTSMGRRNHLQRNPVETSLTMKICVLGCLALIAGFGLYLFWKGVGNVRNAIASTHWPKTTGTIVGSDLSQSSSRDSKTGATSTTYATKTTVRYRVDGQEQTTSLIFFGQTFGSGNPTEAELQNLRYPVGAAVSVSYNPRAPGVAAVKPGLHADTFWLPGAGLAFVIPSIMFAIIYLSLDAGLPGLGIGLGIFAGIFTTIGLIMLTSGLVRLWHGHVSQRWPVTPGRIIYSKESSETSTTEVRDESAHTVTRGAQQVYQADLIYEYEVNGHKHYNNQRRFGELAGGGSERAETIAERYPSGAKVQVAYFPTDPDLAVLETGNFREGIALPAIGAAFLLFGVAVFIWGIPTLTRPEFSIEPPFPQP